MGKILEIPAETMQAFRSRAKMRQQWADLDARREMRSAAMSTLQEEMPDYAAQNIRLDKPADAVRLPAGVFVGAITGRDYGPVTPERWQEAMDALSGPWGRV